MCKNACHHYLSLSTRKWKMQLDVWRQKVTHHVNSTAKVSLSDARPGPNSSKPKVLFSLTDSSIWPPQAEREFQAFIPLLYEAESRLCNAKLSARTWTGSWSEKEIFPSDSQRRGGTLPCGTAVQPSCKHSSISWHAREQQSCVCLILKPVCHLIGCGRLRFWGGGGEAYSAHREVWSKDERSRVEVPKQPGIILLSQNISPLVRHQQFMLRWQN